MSDKIRPIAKLYKSYGKNDNEDYYGIKYFCPTCGDAIAGYRWNDVCEKCGTEFDWGKDRAKIVIHRTVEWDD